MSPWITPVVLSDACPRGQVVSSLGSTTLGGAVFMHPIDWAQRGVKDPMERLRIALKVYLELAFRRLEALEVRL